MRNFLFGLLFSLFAGAAAASPNPCSLPGLPAPTLCYSTLNLTTGYTGPAIEVRRPSDQTSTTISFNADGTLDTTALDAFLINDAYGEVTKRYSQVGTNLAATVATRETFTGNTTLNSTTISSVSTSNIKIGTTLLTGPSGPFPNGTVVTAVGFGTLTTAGLAATTTTGATIYASVAMPPRIKTLAIGTARTVIYEGSSQSGQVFGSTLPSLSGSGCTAQSYTAFSVTRASSSMYRNQAFTPGTGSGTIVSLEGSDTVLFTGDTVVGGTTITNVSSTAGISAGMQINSGPAGPFPFGVQVLSVVGSTVTLFGANALTTTTGGELNATLPLARTYSNGDTGVGNYATTDTNSVSAFTFSPTDAMVEIAPAVLMVSSGATGVQISQNEAIRSTASRSALTTVPTIGYIGHVGSSYGGAYSLAGDFQDAAQIVFCSALTASEKAFIRTALYQRFGIDQRRSRPSAKNVVMVGDSIPAGYVTLGLYGMMARLQALLPDVRFGNYSVPGSQITSSVGMPYYGYTVGMFPASVAPEMSYSKVKNQLIILGGGNDMLDTATATATISLASPAVVTATAHGLEADRRVQFRTTGTLLTPLTTSAVYYVKTVLTPDTFTIAATPGGTAINTSGSQSGVQTLVSYTKTAASIYAGIQNIVAQGLVAGADKVYVATVLPRIGAPYDFILPDLNTLIRANGLGNYTVIDTAANDCLALQPDPPASTTPGPCYYDSGHPNALGHQTAADVMYPIVSSGLQ